MRLLALAFAAVLCVISSTSCSARKISNRGPLALAVAPAGFVSERSLGGDGWSGGTKIRTELPGWFDVGVGSGVAMNVHDGDDNDAAGVLVSLKAYPAGRWYTLGRDSAGNESTYAIAEAHVCRRFSVFYGFSPDNFSGGGLKSPVNVVGVGFDIAPEFAILAGWASYEVEDASSGVTRRDTDFGPYFGVSLNLNSLRTLLGTKVSAPE